MDNTWFTAPGLAAIASLLALWLFNRFTFFKKYFIPQSLLAGSLLLCAGPEAINLIPESNYQSWKQWPGFMISMLFAGLILGNQFGSKSKLSSEGSKTAPTLIRPVIQQTVFVWFIALSQLALGFAVILLTSDLFNVSPLLAHIVEIGWIGGHGSAAALVAITERLGAREVGDLALFSATVGLGIGSFVGLTLVNRIKSDGKFNLESVGDSESQSQEHKSDTNEKDHTLNLFIAVALVFTAVYFGYLLKQFFLAIAGLIGHDGAYYFIEKFPLFSLALLGAIFLRKFLHRPGLISTSITIEVQKVTAFTLDILILSAVASLKIRVITDYFPIFFIIMLSAALWCLALFYFFARRMLPHKHQIELGLLNFGMSTGVTALGLMLVRSLKKDIDPEVARIYGMAAPFSAPLIGGGVISLLLPELTSRGYSLSIFVTLLFAALLLFIVGSYLTRLPPGSE